MAAPLQAHAMMLLPGSSIDYGLTKAPLPGCEGSRTGYGGNDQPPKRARDPWELHATLASQTGLRASARLEARYITGGLGNIVLDSPSSMLHRWSAAMVNHGECLREIVGVDQVVDRDMSAL